MRRSGRRTEMTKEGTSLPPATVNRISGIYLYSALVTSIAPSPIDCLPLMSRDDDRRKDGSLQVHGSLQTCRLQKPQSSAMAPRSLSPPPNHIPEPTPPEWDGPAASLSSPPIRLGCYT